MTAETATEAPRHNPPPPLLSTSSSQGGSLAIDLSLADQGAMIQYIQQATNTRVVTATSPGESAWFQIMVKGYPSGAYKAYKMIAERVEEVDEAVAHVSMPRVKHSLVIGKNGVTIRRISADTNVRIYVPGKKEEPAPNEIQLEGEVENLLQALALIVTAVYNSKSLSQSIGGSGGGSGGHIMGNKDHHQGESLGSPSEEDSRGEVEDVATGENTAHHHHGSITQEGDKTENREGQGEQEEKDPEMMEVMVIVKQSQLRLITNGNKHSAMITVQRLTGARIKKQPKPTPEQLAQEGLLYKAAMESQPQEEGGEDQEGTRPEDEGGDENSSNGDKAEENPQEEGHGGEGHAPAPSVPAYDPDVKVYISGVNPEAVQVAADAIVRIASGQAAAADVIMELKGMSNRLRPAGSVNVNGVGGRGGIGIGGRGPSGSSRAPGGGRGGGRKPMTGRGGVQLGGVKKLVVKGSGGAKAGGGSA